MKDISPLPFGICTRQSTNRQGAKYRKIYICTQYCGYHRIYRAGARQWEVPWESKMRDNMPEIAANMAGTIAEVKVAENDTVQTGQDVVVLESMKMHIPIQTQHAGTVKEVKVNKGDFVNTGHVLLIIE